MTDTTVSRKRVAEFWEGVAARPIKYSEYELSDEHMFALQTNSVSPEASPMKLAHFKAWLAEHDRRVREAAWEEGREAESEAHYVDNGYGNVQHPTNPYAVD